MAPIRRQMTELTVRTERRYLQWGQEESAGEGEEGEGVFR